MLKKIKPIRVSPDKKIEDLTDRQKDVYLAILTYIENHGFPPSSRDVQAMLKLASHATAEQHMIALARKGWIEWEKGKNRGIRLLKEKLVLERLSDLAKTHSVTISNDPVRPKKVTVTIRE